MFGPRRHHRLTFFSAVAFVAAVLSSSEALGCPDCATGRVVRAAVFDASFWTNLTLILLPLVVLGAIAAMLYRIGIERPTEATSVANEEART